MKKIWFLIMVLSLLLSLTACDNSKASNTPVPSTTSEVKQQQKLLSYDQYINLITATKENMKFSSIPMQLTESSLDNPSIVIVNGDMSFGKRKYLTLNDDFKNSTQYFLTYEDTKNSYRLITGWIFTNVDQGNNLIYFKPNIEGNTGDFNSILTYKNILIHIQLITTSSKPSSEDFVKENESVLKEIVNFLEAYVSI